MHPIRGKHGRIPTSSTAWPLSVAAFPALLDPLRICFEVRLAAHLGHVV